MTDRHDEKAREVLPYDIGLDPKVVHAAQLRVAAALRAVERETREQERESGWLIENGKEPPMYRTMGCDGNWTWTADADEALRFARRVDAERACAQDEDAWCVTEHLWPREQEPQPDDAAVERVRQVLREHGWMFTREDYPTIRAAIAAMRKEQP